MSAAVPDLPDDPALLKAMIHELLASLHEKQGQIDHLQDRLDGLLRRLYGQRSQRLDPSQLLLFDFALGDSPPPPKPQPSAQPQPRKRTSNPGRRPFPKDLPRFSRHPRAAPGRASLSLLPARAGLHRQ